jgi:hypothetical protein
MRQLVSRGRVAAPGGASVLEHHDGTAIAKGPYEPRGTRAHSSGGCERNAEIERLVPAYRARLPLAEGVPFLKRLLDRRERAALHDPMLDQVKIGRSFFGDIMLFSRRRPSPELETPLSEAERQGNHKSRPEHGTACACYQTCGWNSDSPSLWPSTKLQHRDVRRRVHDLQRHPAPWSRARERC